MQIQAALDQLEGDSWFGELVTEPRNDALPEAIALEQARDLVNPDINSVSLPNEARVAWQEEDDLLRVFANGDSACFSRDTLPALMQLCDTWHLAGDALAALHELEDGRALLAFLIHTGALNVE
jgi:50S ribosomal protein L16 3-hydroxylase